MSEPELIRTHDAMRDLINSVAGGARVELHRVARGDDACRAYTLTLTALGREPVNVGDSYALPCPAANIRRRVRELLYAARARL